MRTGGSPWTGSSAVIPVRKLRSIMDKKLFRSILLIITYAVLLVMVLARLDVIGGALGTLLAVFKPIIIGFCLAFILNRPCQFFYRLYSKGLDKTPARGAARPLAVLTAYLALILLIVALFSFVLPKLVESIQTFVLNLGGYITNAQNSINQLLDNVQGKKEQNLIETLAIRSMAKAAYSTTNIGHYGLAFDYYTHFTSPIRRYPDMMVHRLLARYAEGGRSVNKEEWEGYCKHSSDMETVAANAERASIKYKQVEFMSAHLGEVFDGVISGVTEWGIYVEITANKCEGMIPIRDLDDDYYAFDEKNYCLVGRRHHRRYQLGDELRVKIAKTNLDKKQLDFALAEPEE